MKKRLKKYGPMIAVALVVLAVATVYYMRWRGARTQELPPVTAAVERRDIVLKVVAVGVLDPLTTVEVKSSVAGEVIELAVDRGDPVEAGELIARIDPTQTKAAFDQAQASVESATARIRETEADLARQRRSTSAQVSAAGDGVRTGEARVRQSLSSLEQQKQVTEADIRRASESVEAARARLAQAQARARAQPAQTEAAIRRAEAEHEAARQALLRLSSATHPQERAAAEARAAASAVAAANSRKSVERLRRLHERGGAAQAELEAAETALANAEDGHANARAALDTLDSKHGSEVKEAQARVRQAEASLAAANAAAADIEIAREELRAAQAAVRESEANLAAARAGVALTAVKADDVEVARAGAREARSQLEVARANTLIAATAAHQVTQARAGATGARAQLSDAEKNLAYTAIAAPRDGVVVDRYVEAGSVVTSGRAGMAGGDTLVTIADVTRMFVLVDVDEADIGSVRVGQPAEVFIETFPRKEIRGKVVQVFPRAEVVDGVTVFKVRVEIDDPSPELRPGMTGEVSIITARKDNVLAVPAEGVFRQEGETFAEIAKNGKRETVPVKAGLSDFDWTEIIEGLKEGDEVVLETRAPEAPGRPNDPSRTMRGMQRAIGGR